MAHQHNGYVSICYRLVSTSFCGVIIIIMQKFAVKLQNKVKSGSNVISFLNGLHKRKIVGRTTFQQGLLLLHQQYTWCNIFSQIGNELFVARFKCHNSAHF